MESVVKNFSDKEFTKTAEKTYQLFCVILCKDKEKRQKTYCKSISRSVNI